MTRDEMIRRFKDACNNPINDKVRKAALGNGWIKYGCEVVDESYTIRIDTSSHFPQIIVRNGFSEIYSAPLSTEEFKDLQKLFIGDFQRKDMRICSVIKQWVANKI